MMEVEDNSSKMMMEDILLVHNMPLILRISRFVCITLGIPINGLILTVILRSRQLWSTNRNIFWLITTLLNLLAIIQAVIELVIYYVYQHQSLESDKLIIYDIYAIFAGLPYALLQSTFIVATMERCLILAQPQFYRQHIIHSRICSILLFILVTVTGAYYFIPYWIGYLEADRLILSLSINCFLTTICLICQIWLNCYIRTCINHSRDMKNKSSTNSPAQQPSLIPSAVAAARLLSPSSIDSEGGSGRVRRLLRSTRFATITNPSGQRLSRLEVKSAKIFNIAILPYCFINLPASICSAIVAYYSKANAMSNNDNISSYWFLAFIVFLRVLTLYNHLIYIPSIFAAQSREFRLARR